MFNSSSDFFWDGLPVTENVSAGGSVSLGEVSAEYSDHLNAAINEINNSSESSAVKEKRKAYVTEALAILSMQVSSADYTLAYGENRYRYKDELSGVTYQTATTSEGGQIQYYKNGSYVYWVIEDVLASLNAGKNYFMDCAGFQRLLAKLVGLKDADYGLTYPDTADYNTLKPGDKLTCRNGSYGNSVSHVMIYLYMSGSYYYVADEVGVKYGSYNASNGTIAVSGSSKTYYCHEFYDMASNI